MAILKHAQGPTVILTNLDKGTMSYMVLLIGYFCLYIRVCLPFLAGWELPCVSGWARLIICSLRRPVTKSVLEIVYRDDAIEW